jgi:hypothetical protein
MQCQHCGEELEPRMIDDPAARCPSCEQLLAEMPVDFQQIHSVGPQDLEAVSRVVETLQRSSPELFILPAVPQPLPTTALPGTHAGTRNTSPPPWAELLLQPAPALPTETNNTSLNWLFLGIGILGFACGGVLLILATALTRTDLWTIGFPLVLGGQGGIIFGLVGLLETQQQRAKRWQEVCREQRDQHEMLKQMVLLQSPETNYGERSEHTPAWQKQWRLLQQMRASRAA